MLALRADYTGARDEALASQGSVQQLGITDPVLADPVLADPVLADPLMREIAQTFGRTPDAPTLMGGAGQLGLLTNGNRIGNTLVRMTVQCNVQALKGGEFRDGWPKFCASLHPRLPRAGSVHLVRR